MAFYFYYGVSMPISNNIRVSSTGTLRNQIINKTNQKRQDLSASIHNISVDVTDAAFASSTLNQAKSEGLLQQAKRDIGAELDKGPFNQKIDQLVANLRAAMTVEDLRDMAISAAPELAENIRELSTINSLLGQIISCSESETGQGLFTERQLNSVMEKFERLITKAINDTKSSHKVSFQAQVSQLGEEVLELFLKIPEGQEARHHFESVAVEITSQLCAKITDLDPGLVESSIDAFINATSTGFNGYVEYLDLLRRLPLLLAQATDLPPPSSDEVDGLPRRSSSEPIQKALKDYGAKHTHYHTHYHYGSQASTPSVPEMPSFTFNPTFNPVFNPVFTPTSNNQGQYYNQSAQQASPQTPAVEEGVTQSLNDAVSSASPDDDSTTAKLITAQEPTFLASSEEVVQTMPSSARLAEAAANLAGVLDTSETGINPLAAKAKVVSEKLVTALQVAQSIAGTTGTTGTTADVQAVAAKVTPTQVSTLSASNEALPQPDSAKIRLAKATANLTGVLNISQTSSQTLVEGAKRVSGTLFDALQAAQSTIAVAAKVVPGHVSTFLASSEELAQSASSKMRLAQASAKLTKELEPDSSAEASDLIAGVKRVSGALLNTLTASQSTTSAAQVASVASRTVREQTSQSIVSSTVVHQPALSTDQIVNVATEQSIDIGTPVKALAALNVQAKAALATLVDGLQAHQAVTSSSTVRFEIKRLTAEAEDYLTNSEIVQLNRLEQINGRLVGLLNTADSSQALPASLLSIIKKVATSLTDLLKAAQLSASVVSGAVAAEQKPVTKIKVPQFVSTLNVSLARPSVATLVMPSSQATGSDLTDAANQATQQNTSLVDANQFIEVADVKSHSVITKKALKLTQTGVEDASLKPERSANARLNAATAALEKTLNLNELTSKELIQQYGSLNIGAQAVKTSLIGEAKNVSKQLSHLLAESAKGYKTS